REEREERGEREMEWVVYIFFKLVTLLYEIN
ncbi:unnamed protein product, partial [marine sediment metagenome]